MSARGNSCGWLLIALAACAQPPAPPAGLGTAQLSWARPARRVDGAPLEDLAGYRIYYGNSPSALYYKVEVNDPVTTGWTIGDLTPGTWYFRVAAIDDGGRESVPSQMASKVIR